MKSPSPKATVFHHRDRSRERRAEMGSLVLQRAERAIRRAFGFGGAT